MRDQAFSNVRKTVSFIQYVFMILSKRVKVLMLCIVAVRSYSQKTSLSNNK